MKTTRVKEQQNEPSMEDILSSIRKIISGEGKESKVPSYATDPIQTNAPENDQEILDLIYMLREDNSVKVVQPFNSSPTQAATKKTKSRDENETPKIIEESADSSEEADPALKEAPSKKRLSISEEEALENIAKTLTETDQSTAGNKNLSHEEEAFNELHETMTNLSDDVQKNFMSDNSIDDLLSEEALSEAAEALDVLAQFTDSSPASAPIKQMGGKTVEDLMKEVLRPLLKDWLNANLPSIVRTIVTEQVQKIVQQKVKQGSVSHKVS